MTSTPLRTRNSVRPVAVAVEGGDRVPDARGPRHGHGSEGEVVVAQHHVVGIGRSRHVRDQGVDVEVPVAVGVAEGHRPAAAAARARPRPSPAVPKVPLVFSRYSTRPHSRRDQVLVAVAVEVAEVGVGVMSWPARWRRPRW